jgi:hypothetical protein
MPDHIVSALHLTSEHVVSALHCSGGVRRSWTSSDPHAARFLERALRSHSDWADVRVGGLPPCWGSFPGRPRLVVVESPYAGDVALNVAYARACARDCLLRQEAPMLSHLLYTQDGVLRDDVPCERALGIEAGLAWGRVAEATVVYQDLGVSDGMRQGIERARAEGRVVEFRNLTGWKD